jgi:TolA-binding protein
VIREACPDDVFARARAGSLSAVEHDRLERHLAGCETCRAMVFLGTGFDQRVSAQAEDMQVLARVVDRVQAARADRGISRERAAPVSRIQALARPRRSRIAVLLVAAALTGGAAAAVPATRTAVLRVVSLLLATTEEPRAPGTTAGAPEAPGAPASVRTPEPTVAPPPDTATPVVDSAEAGAVPAPAVALPASPGRTNSRASPVPSGKSRTDDAITASRLFAEANARRKSGDTASARKLYAELERRFPGSPEAQVSSASLGRLLLERAGDPAGALEQFDRLLSHPSGSMAQPALAEEALFGRATALMRMGRAADEKQTWLELLGRFPGSVYAARARERLRALK